ncbi:hypothetical protein OQA88_8873 [Cercophora sp. LCS_1]
MSTPSTNSTIRFTDSDIFGGVSQPQTQHPGSSPAFMPTEQGNYNPAVRGLRSLQYTVTVRQGEKKVTCSECISYEAKPGQTEHNITLNPSSIDPVSVSITVCHFNGAEADPTPQHRCGRGSEAEYFNTAFYGQLPSGFPNFGSHQFVPIDPEIMN